MTLVLTRKSGQSITIGEHVTVRIKNIARGQVQLAIDAPDDVLILRTELLERGGDDETEPS